MKRFAMTAILMEGMAWGACIQAQNQEPDSLWNMHLQEVEVVSTRATSTTPVAFTNIGKEQLQKQNLGQDLP